jgi:hypothetical protein
MRPALVSLIGCLAVALAVAAGAGAGGGLSIAAAPSIQPGVEEVTDTSSDQTLMGTQGSEKTGCWSRFVYWRLALRAGDAVSITGRNDGASGFMIGIFPAGTTDANIRTTNGIALGKVPNSGPLKFTASSTGVYPVVVGPNCHDGSDGALSFVTTVTHSAEKQKVVATIDPIARLAHNGTVTAKVRAPYSTAIHDPNLVLKLYGTWKDVGAAAATEHLLGTGSAKQGSVRFKVTLPASVTGTVQLRVRGGGGDYQPMSSAALTVTVA